MSQCCLDLMRDIGHGPRFDSAQDASIKDGVDQSLETAAPIADVGLVV